MKFPPPTLTEIAVLRSLAPVCELLGRVLLCLLFLIAGLIKIGTYAEMVAYMSSHGVPAVLLPAVIATETLGALAVALGWKTRVVVFLLAGYSLITALIFHHDLILGERVTPPANQGDHLMPIDRLFRLWSMWQHERRMRARLILGAAQRN